jgi:hypothetical protein
MNSKMLFAILTIVVVGGGLFAVKNMQTKVETDDVTASSESAGETGNEGGTSSRGGSRVSAMNDRGAGGERRSLADRTIRRSPGAATMDVTPVTTGSAGAAAAGRTPRPSEETLAENRSVADLTNMFKSQTDPDARIEIADELGLIDSPESIRSALELLRDEKDPAVQEALIEAMQGLEAQEEMADEIYRAVSDIYMKTDNEDVKVAAQDLMGDLATQEAAAGLKQVAAQGAAAAGEASAVHINAAENLLRIAQGNAEAVSPQESSAITQGLKDQYTQGGDAGQRQQIIMALATNGRENADFFQQALQTEPDPQNREMLQRLVRMFTAPPPATPPPGTVVTPVPTLVPTAAPGQ